MKKKYYILWTTTLRKLSLIEYIIHIHNGSLWCPKFKCINNEGQEEYVQIYPSYYFVHCSEEDCYEMQDYIKSKRYDGMFFLKTDDKIASLKEEEIEQIKYIENTYTMDKYFNINPNIKIGTLVKILKGPFMGVKGEVLQIKNMELLLNISDKGIKLWVAMDNVQL